MHAIYLVMWRNTHLAYMVVALSCIKQFVDAAGSGMSQDGLFGDLLGALQVEKEGEIKRFMIYEW